MISVTDVDYMMTLVIMIMVMEVVEVEVMGLEICGRAGGY